MQSNKALNLAAAAFLARISRNDTWRDEALCLDDPELFFPVNDRGPEAKRAITICKACPVRKQCLELALAYDERVGIWGGFTTAQRGRMPHVKRRRHSYGRREGSAA